MGTVPRIAITLQLGLSPFFTILNLKNYSEAPAAIADAICSFIFASSSSNPTSAVSSKIADFLRKYQPETQLNI